MFCNKKLRAKVPKKTGCLFFCEDFYSIKSKTLQAKSFVIDYLKRAFFKHKNFNKKLIKLINQVKTKHYSAEIRY